MTILFLLAPLSLLLACIGLAGFFWTFKAGQYDDPKGDAARILFDHLDDKPATGPAAGAGQPQD